jgi:hypothetical protein
MHKELTVSLGSGDGRVEPPGHLAVVSNQGCGHIGAHTLMDGRVSNDPAPAIHFGLAGLELRLDEQHELSACSAGSDEMR